MPSTGGTLHLDRRMLLRRGAAALARRAAAPRRALACAAAAAAPAPALGARVALVQGASRGLGLEFVAQLLARPEYGTVVATCRAPAAAAGLAALAGAHAGRLRVVPLDAADEASIEAAAERVAALGVTHLDLLINAAGVLHDAAAGLAPETALARVTAASLARSFAVNAAGPALVLKAFTPLLAAAPGASDARPAVAASLSARVGSIGDNRLGGWYSYRASKAALNQLTATAALELRRRGRKVCLLLLHPGTCDTDLSRPFQANVPPGKLFPRERGVRQMLALLDRATMADSGAFLAWDGSTVPW